MVSLITTIVITQRLLRRHTVLISKLLLSVAIKIRKLSRKIQWFSPQVKLILHSLQTKIWHQTHQDLRQILVSPEAKRGLHSLEKVKPETLENQFRERKIQSNQSIHLNRRMGQVVYQHSTCNKWIRACHRETLSILQPFYQSLTTTSRLQLFMQTYQEKMTRINSRWDWDLLITRNI